MKNCGEVGDDKDAGEVVRMVMWIVVKVVEGMVVPGGVEGDEGSGSVATIDFKMF